VWAVCGLRVGCVWVQLESLTKRSITRIKDSLSMRKVVLLNDSLRTLLSITKKDLEHLSDKRGHEKIGPRCEIGDMLCELSQLRNHFADDWRKEMITNYIPLFEQYLLLNNCSIGITSYCLLDRFV